MATMARCTLKCVPFTEHFPRPGDKEAVFSSHLRPGEAQGSEGWAELRMENPSLVLSTFAIQSVVYLLQRDLVAGGWLHKFQASHGGDYL